MVFTTNKELREWGKVLHDEDLATAILDRVLERGRHLKLDGPSLRTRHLGLDDRHLRMAGAPAPAAGQLVHHRPAKNVATGVGPRSIEVPEAHASL